MNRKMKRFCEKKRENTEYYSKVEWTKLFKIFTILLGPNGTGKTMSLLLMKEYLEKSSSNKVFSYSTSKDDVVKKYTGPFDFRPEALVSAFSSEGERMDYSFYTWLKEIFPTIINSKDKDIYIFIDEADSGLSIDRMIGAFRDFIYVIKDLVNSRDYFIRVVITCNSYELAEIFNDHYEQTSYIWVPTKEFISLGSYHKFKKRYLEYYEEMWIHE